MLFYFIWHVVANKHGISVFKELSILLKTLLQKENFEGHRIKEAEEEKVNDV